MESLARFADLEVLDLRGKLTHQSIGHLRSLQNLRELRLNVEQIPKSAMETIAEFQRLELLSLRAARLGDDQLAPLRGHPSLRRLFLNSACVTDRSLEVLESLEHVSLRGNDESKRIEEVVIGRTKTIKTHEKTKAGGSQPNGSD